jgi:hypothetical protein
MNQIVLSASAALIDAASAILHAPSSWPEPAIGLASRIFTRVAMPLVPLMSQPLRQTTAALLRRTPEIAAFGYVLDRADAETSTLWNEAIEHLRGREIYPADRQSFIFNPIEILGVAAGLVTPSAIAEHREQFRTPLSLLAAHTALTTVDEVAGRKQAIAALNVNALGTPDLMLAAAIYLAFGGPVAGDDIRVERELMSRALTQPIPIGDAAEAAALAVLATRAGERAALAAHETSPEDRIVALCRRFPLFVDRLQHRQRSRAPVSVDDEYDVQDLLHAILKLNFDDVRPEEVTPSYAGNASRVDFYLPRERIVVEAKMTRGNLGQKDVANQLVIDVARYAQMATVDTLVCLVYDPGRKCSNPRTLENDIEASLGRLKVRAIVCPQGL